MDFSCLDTSNLSPDKVELIFLYNYYTALEENPPSVVNFYIDACSMMLIDGEKKEKLIGLKEINEAITSLKFRKIEIKTAESLDSCGEVVLLKVSGLGQIGNDTTNRKFTQTFLLARTLGGYGVCYDMLHFLEDEPHPGQGDSSSIFLGNLPSGTGVQQLWNTFKIYGEIKPLDIQLKGGFAYIKF